LFCQIREPLATKTLGQYQRKKINRREHLGGLLVTDGCTVPRIVPFLLLMTTEKATFGAGCFWGVEETFRNLKGVLSTAVGYAGGTRENPTYEDVCTDKTGHAEVVAVEFDPSQITYNELLDVFWSNHNPTTLNRQGPDVGTQYRSVIFYHSPEQKSAAEASRKKIDLSGRFGRPVVTQIESAPQFWRAEEYHQRYLQKRGKSHCAI
jgi:peptide-methionine (S)-S-oxide reductase